MIDRDILDLANVLVGIVVDVETDQLRTSSSLFGTESNAPDVAPLQLPAEPVEEPLLLRSGHLGERVRADRHKDRISVDIPGVND